LPLSFIQLLLSGGVVFILQPDHVSLLPFIMLAVGFIPDCMACSMSRVGFFSFSFSCVVLAHWPPPGKGSTFVSPDSES